ncbi:hypothetical protein BX600DRAFT_321245 [Xylariales sp. PMI_506]|nr:hypothetical protein BX600DRAFT_321245 [Xylariales sp. PMI_506]
MQCCSTELHQQLIVLFLLIRHEARGGGAKKMDSFSTFCIYAEMSSSLGRLNGLAIFFSLTFLLSRSLGVSYQEAHDRDEFSCTNWARAGGHQL